MFLDLFRWINNLIDYSNKIHLYNYLNYPQWYEMKGYDSFFIFFREDGLTKFIFVGLFNLSFRYVFLFLNAFFLLSYNQLEIS